MSSSAIGSLYPGKRPIIVHPMPDVNSPQRLSPLGWEHVVSPTAHFLATKQPRLCKCHFRRKRDSADVLFFRFVG